MEHDVEIKRLGRIKNLDGLELLAEGDIIEAEFMGAGNGVLYNGRAMIIKLGDKKIGFVIPNRVVNMVLTKFSEKGNYFEDFSLLPFDGVVSEKAGRRYLELLKSRLDYFPKEMWPKFLTDEINPKDEQHHLYIGNV